MKNWKWTLPTVFLLGAVLRLIWPSDMEFKDEHQFIFTQVQNFFIITEIGLVRIVMLLNTAALGLLMLVGYRFLPWLYGDKKLADRDQPVWLWSSVLVAVNPLALLFERKIWAQGLLPFFSLLFLFSWLKRSSRWGGFFWGFIGACLGLIHFSGFFFAAGFLGWTLYKERTQETTNTNWKGCLVGSGVSAVLISPWIYSMILQMILEPHLPARNFNLNFWMFWIEDAIGLSALSDTLGPFIEAFYGDYILAKLSRIALIATALIIYGAAIWHYIRFPKNLKNILKPHSPASEATVAAGFGMGVLITAFPIAIYRHFLIVTHPLQWFFLVRLALDHLKRSKTALMIIFFGNLSLSLLLLYFLHINGGAPGGDYGTAFKLQPRFQKSPNSP